MGAVVNKSSPVVVRPSELPQTMSSTATTIKLSSFDKVVEKVPITALFVFEHPVHEAAESIKRALSKALVHYYPFAGRIVAGDAGGGDEGVGQIRCSGEGVVFVTASASCAVEEVIVSDQSPGARMLRHKLAVYYPGERCGGPADPLLLVQVTEFACGGFVLGVTWNHAVADGAGIAQFLQAVGELARGLPSPSVAPVRRDDSLPASLQAVLPLQRLRSMDPFHDLVYIDFTVPWGSIDRIRAEFGSRFGCRPCTVFDAVIAVVWRCRTRAVMHSGHVDPEAPALLFFSANARRLVGAKRGYYGNCMTPQLVMEKSGAVAGGDVVDLAKKIKDAKKKVPDQFKDDDGEAAAGSTGGGDPRQTMNSHHQLVLQARYNMLIVSSWMNLGLEEIDLGSGTPARIAPRTREKAHFPAFAVLPPCKGRDDGANVSSSIVKEEHADAFLQELASLQYCTPGPRSRI